ncbi:MAG TPA: cytochrome b/b6 domain-containing protein [Gryllotalpicola sp.]
MAGEPLRRGLPRRAGADPWPPAGATAAFEVVAPSPVRGAVATPEPIVAQAATPAPAPRARRTGLPRSAAAAAAQAPAPAPAGPVLAVAEPAPPATPATRRAGLPRGGAGADITAAAAVSAASVSSDSPGAASVAPVGTLLLQSPPADAAGPAVAAPASTSSAAPPAAPSAGRSRFGRRAFAWGAAAVVVIVVAVLLSRWFLLGTAAGTRFLADYPGTTPLPDWAPRGIPSWLGWQHFLNAFFLILVIRTGWIVRTTRRPSASWSPRGSKAGGRKIAIELWAHLALDLLWIVNGVVFLVLIFSTGQWTRIVPTSWGVVPNAASAALQYLSLHWPSEDGWVNYNSLQLLAYCATVFVAAPLAAVTGLRMSPLWPTRRERLTRAYPVELARAIHFPVMLYFVLFVIVHVGLVLTTGPLRNLNHMYGGQDVVNWWGAGVFLLSLVAMVGGWLIIRPMVMQQVGALFGRVGR